MTPSQNLVCDLVDLNVRIRLLAQRLKNHGKQSVSYIDLFRSFADTVEQVAKEVAAQ
jgi:hypothetical protein